MGDRYKSGSYYDEPRRQTTGSSGYRDRSQPQNNRYYSQNVGNSRGYDDRSHSHHGGRYQDNRYYESMPRRRTSTSYQMPNLFDGSLISMAILMVIGVVCQRLGINPFQVFAMVRMATGNRRLRWIWRRIWRWVRGRIRSSQVRTSKTKMVVCVVCLILYGVN